MPNIPRLERLIKVLEAVRDDPKKRRDFDMDHWAKKTPECGTHMCACGYAAIDPELNKQGLWLDFANDLTGVEEPVAILRFGEHRMFVAAQKFFGLSSSEVTGYLFDPGEYDNPEADAGDWDPQIVIDRIRKVIDEASV